MKSDCEHPSIPEYLAYLEGYAAHFDLLPLIRFGVAVQSVRESEDGGYTLTTATNVTTSGGDDDTATVAPQPRRSPRRHAGSTRRAERSATANVASFEFDCVAICSGLHNVPYVPTALTRGFTGEVIHSSDYKNDTPFRGVNSNGDPKRVLVIGCGETGMDVVYQAVYSTSSPVHLCVRKGFLSIPHEISGIALDTIISNVGEAAYQHRWIEAMKLRWCVSTIFIRLALLCGSGTSRGYNQWGPATATPMKRGHHIINKQVKAMPFINRPFKRLNCCNRAWSCLWRSVGNADDLSREAIVLHNAAVKEVKGKTVTFADGTSCEVDVMLLATGYKQKFPFLENNNRETRSRNVSELDDDPLPSERLICAPTAPHLGFIGFVRPNVGAIPPMSELQCLWWIERMEGRLGGVENPPLAAPTYELLSRNTRTGSYAVDYGAYMHDLARDANAAPDLFGCSRRGESGRRRKGAPETCCWWWCAHPRALLTYAIGQAYVSHFRLHGPFVPGAAAESEGGEDGEIEAEFREGQRVMTAIVEDELFGATTRRGCAANLVFIAVALLFSAINLLAFVLDCLLLKCIY